MSPQLSKYIDYHPKQYATAGVRLHFKTDSKSLYMKVLTSMGSSRKFFAHDVLVNGEYIGSLKNSTENVYGEFEKIFELGEGVKDVCVHFPWSVCSILKELRLKENSMLYDSQLQNSKEKEESVQLILTLCWIRHII